MARDCPDRQRGTDWRNNGYGRGPQRAIGGGDAVDREMEVSLCPLHYPWSSVDTDVYTSNSCKNSLAVLHLETAKLPDGSKGDPVATIKAMVIVMTVMRSRGNAVLPQAMWPRGSSEVAGTVLATTMDLETTLLPRGRRTAVVPTMDMAPMPVATLLLEPLPGNSSPRLHPPVDKPAMDMVDILHSHHQLPTWELLQAFLLFPLHHLVWVLCIMVRAAHRLHLLVKDLLLLRPVTSLPHLPLLLEQVYN